MAEAPPGVPGAAEFELFEAAFLRAAGAAGGIVGTTIEIGGFPVRLEFAGSALAARMSAPFAHLAMDAPAEVVFRCWDSESTGVEFPEAFAPYQAQPLSMPSLQRESSVRWTHTRPDPGLTGYNADTSTAVYWFPTSTGLTFGDLAGGLRAAITWAMAAREMAFLHTAAVGFEGKAALIVGASGSGKSSTALACLLEGLDFLGDDHCLVSRGPAPRVHAVYAAAKLHTEQMLRFPELHELIVNPDREPWDKAVAILHPHFQRQLPRKLPVACVLVPRISEGREASVEPLSRGAALLALAPSTLLQMTAADGNGLAWMGELVRNVPCYRLTVGSERAAIAGCITRLLAELPAP